MRRNPLHSWPALFRLMLLHGVIGFAIASISVAALLWFDHSSLLSLMRADVSWPLPLILLWLLLGSSLGAVQIAIAVMGIGALPEKPRGGGGSRIPLRVRAAAPQRR